MPGYGLEGVSQAETDEFHSAQTTKALGEVAMQPFEARKKAAEAQHKELEVETERRMMEAGRRRAEARAQGGPTQGLQVSAAGNSAEDLAATQLFEFAQDAMDAGRPKLAGEIADKAAHIRQRKASGDNSQASARLRALQGEIQAANLVARHINADSVKDETSWRRAWGNLGIDPPAPYSPELVKEIQRAALSEHDAMTGEHQRLTRAETQRMNSARIQDIIDRKPLIKSQMELNTARVTRLGRDHGSQGTGEPKAADIKLVTDLLRPTVINIDPEELRSVGRDVAREAQDRVTRNPAVKYHQAVKEILTERKAAGEFDVYGHEKPKEVLGGKSKEKPLTVPTGPNGAALMGKLIKGRWYNTPKGPLQWTGSVFSTSADEDEED